MSVVGTDGAMSAAGLGRTLRTLRDPLLLFAAPVVFGFLVAYGYGNSWPIGFDFRGTLWEPARSLLDGLPIYPEPTRDAVLVGNPAVYPPLYILGSVPLALLPASLASWLWLCVLALVLLGSMWIVGVRDWRCLVLAATSPVVVHGLWYGNLTVFLVLPLALAWRYRDRARVAGIAVGRAANFGFLRLATLFLAQALDLATFSLMVARHGRIADGRLKWPLTLKNCAYGSVAMASARGSVSDPSHSPKSAVPAAAARAPTTAAAPSTMNPNLTSDSNAPRSFPSIASAPYLTTACHDWKLTR